MKYQPGQQVIASFGVTSLEYRASPGGGNGAGPTPISHLATIIEELPLGDGDLKVRYLVRLDQVDRRDYVMLEEELTTVEELFA